MAEDKPTAPRTDDAVDRGDARQTVNAWETEQQVDTVELSADSTAPQGGAATMASLTGLMRPTGAEASVQTLGLAETDDPAADPAAIATPTSVDPGGAPAPDSPARAPSVSGPTADTSAPQAVLSAPVPTEPAPTGFAGPALATVDGVAMPVGQAPVTPVPPSGPVTGAQADAAQASLAGPAEAGAAAPGPDPGATPADPAPDPDPAPEPDAPAPGWATGGSASELTAEGVVLGTLSDGGEAFVLTDADGQPIDHPLLVLDGASVLLRAGASLDFETAETIAFFVRRVGSDDPPERLTLEVLDAAEVIELDDGGATFTDRGIAEIELRGGAGDDLIAGGTGDDTLAGGGGNDRLIGGGGRDTARFSGRWEDYRIAPDGDALRVTDLRPGAPDGSDLLTGVERLAFADRTLDAEAALNVAPTLSVVGGTVTEGTEGAAVGTVTAVDANAGDRLTLTIDDDRFALVGDRLVLRPGAALDYETDGARVEVTVTATDLAGARTEAVIEISVRDRAEIVQLADGGVSLTDLGLTETAILGGNGDDAIRGSAGDDSLVGGTGNDVLTGGNGDDSLSGGAGDDRLSGGGGEDSAIFRGALSDYAVRFDEDGDTFTLTDLLGRDGTDTATEFERFVFADRTLDADDLRAEADRQANATPGDPTVATPPQASEALTAGSVVARLTAQDADGDPLTYRLVDETGTPMTHPLFEIAGDTVRLRAGAALDYESATEHTFHVVADDGLATSRPTAVTLQVTDAAEEIRLGDSGVSFIDRGLSETRITGGAGDDSLTATGGGTLDGGAGDDRLTGSSGDDLLIGGAGADRLDGGDRDDRLFGGDGDDLLRGGEGRNVIDGGAGTDTAEWDVAREGLEIRYDADSDTFTLLDPVSMSLEDSVTGVETFRFADGTFDAAEMRAEAARQADAVSDSTPPPGAGADVIGGSGDDWLSGGAGDDTLIGLAGDDTLVGMGGDDRLDGGEGADLYVIGPGDGADRIVDGGAWTDVIALEGRDGPVTLTADGAAGQGWTLVLDEGHDVLQTSDGAIDLSGDAAGTLIFDDGGSVDFTGIDRVTW